jgi:outer membrane protein OmpA-like peptidoglycan-associated protein
MKIFKVFFFLFVGVLSSFSQSKIIFQDTVLFAYNQAALNATAEAKLERLMEKFRTETSTHFELWGRASSEGDIAYNQALSERRTKSVEAY